MKFSALVIVSCMLMASFVAYADFVDVSADSVVKTNTSVYVRGWVRFDNATGMANVNVTVNLSGNWTLVTTDENGTFSVNVTSPLNASNYTVRVTTNTSLVKTLPVAVRNISAANLSFIAQKPPFTNGSAFLINVTFDGTPLTAPLLMVFNPNGNTSSGWTIVNITPANSTIITYNVTVASDADGEYALVVEQGAGFLFFLVKSSVTVALDIQDLDNATATAFAPAETVRIIAKVRNDDGPITTASGVAFVTLPNATVRNFSLTHSSEVNGTYSVNFGETTTVGSYAVKVVATVSGRTIESTNFFTIKTLEGKLDIVKDFFFEFGGSSAFSSGGQVAFSVLVFDTATDGILSGSAAGAGGAINCSSITPTLFKNVVTGAVVPYTTANLTKSVTNFLGQDVCKINFTAPAANGIYQLTINASVGPVGNTSVLATGYFSIQSFILKVGAVSSIGGGNEFMSSLVPGTNATFDVSARNLSNNASSVNNSLITNISVIRISPQNFLSGSGADITTLTASVTPGSDGTNARVTVLLPENQTGPFNIEIQANVSGTIIRGTAFYFAKYVEGFVQPDGFFGSSGGGGMSAGQSFKCSGTRTFIATVFDVRTRQNARNVVFNSLQEAREEASGKSMLSFLTLNATSATDTNGRANLTITFSNTTAYSGFYFFLANITTGDGKADILPGGFDCKSLKFFPMISALGGYGFNVAPTSTLNITILDIVNLNNGTPYTVRSGTVRILKLENFDPTKGGKFYAGPATTFNLSNGTVGFNLTAGNFSLGRWPSGFNNMRLYVCDNTTTPATCDIGFSGFRAVSFDAFMDFSFSTPSQVVPLQNVTLRVQARTNITRNSGNYTGLGSNTTTTGFVVKIGRPWDGSLVEAAASGLLLNDNWNGSLDFGAEIWNITFTVPATVRKGGTMVMIEAKNYLNDTTQIDFFLNVVKNNVYVPDTEGVLLNGNWSVLANHTNISHVIATNLTFGIDLNLTNILYNVYSKSGRACGTFGFNSTRYGMSSTTVLYNTTTAILAIDNATAGVYDTVIFRNNMSGNISIVHAGNRSLAAQGPGFAGIYLRAIKDCYYVEIIDANSTPSGFGSGFGGQHRKGVPFTIPFIVKNNNAPVAGSTINIAQVVRQQDFGGGRGGYGFEEFVTTGFTRTAGVTDAAGVAFVTLNFSTSGLFGLLWNATVNGELDTAEFSQVVPTEVKSFSTTGGVFDSGSGRLQVLTMNLSQSGTVSNATLPGFAAYVTTWNESSQGELLDLLSTGVIYGVLRNVTQMSLTSPFIELAGFTELVFDNDANFNGSMFEGGDGLSPVNHNWSQLFGPPDWLGNSFRVDGNVTIDANITKLLLANPNSGSYTSISNPLGAMALVRNVTVRVCASTFDKPAQPLLGGRIVLTMDVFSGFGPPTSENLTMYDPFNYSIVPFVLTGPSGCASFNISRAGGWTRGSPNNIRGTIVWGGDTENVFAGMVQI